jgi:hypothetical protein
MKDFTNNMSRSHKINLHFKAHKRDLVLNLVLRIKSQLYLEKDPRKP